MGTGGQEGRRAGEGYRSEDYLGIEGTGCDRVVLHVVNLLQFLNNLPGVLSFQCRHSDNLTQMMLMKLIVKRV